MSDILREHPDIIGSPDLAFEIIGMVTQRLQDELGKKATAAVTVVETLQDEVVTALAAHEQWRVELHALYEYLLEDNRRAHEHVKARADREDSSPRSYRGEARLQGFPLGG